MLAIGKTCLKVIDRHRCKTVRFVQLTMKIFFVIMMKHELTSKCVNWTFINVLEIFPIGSSIFIFTSWNCLSQFNAGEIKIPRVLTLHSFLCCVILFSRTLASFSILFRTFVPCFRTHCQEKNPDFLDCGFPPSTSCNVDHSRSTAIIIYPQPCPFPTDQCHLRILTLYCF